jgi:hypothetical protein
MGLIRFTRCRQQAFLRFFNPRGIEKPARFSHWAPNAVGTWALAKTHNITAESICQELFLVISKQLFVEFCTDLPQ